MLPIIQYASICNKIEKEKEIIHHLKAALKLIDSETLSLEMITEEKLDLLLVLSSHKAKLLKLSKKAHLIEEQFLEEE